MALWEGFIDESYAEERTPQLTVVGGYLLRSEDAKRMSAEWKAVLDKYEVDYFHMVEVAPGEGNGIFRKLGKKGCDLLAREMIGLIRKYDMYAYASVINTKRNWLSTNKYIESVYAAAVDQCVGKLMVYAQCQDPDAEFAFIVEKGHKDHASANRSLTAYFDKRTDCHPHTFASKKTVYLLQAADIFVWQLQKYIKDQVNNERPPRKDFLALVIGKPHACTFYYLYKGMPTIGPLYGDELFTPRNLHRAFDEEIPKLTFDYSFRVNRRFYKVPTIVDWGPPPITYFAFDPRQKDRIEKAK
jgi:hypothetical protein